MKQNSNKSIKLTQYSHGAGCGCKIAPQVLNEILHTSVKGAIPEELLVGHDTRDDAAVFAINDQQAVISTTDFFMPIVDDPFDFGAIASVNAISDIYAMGGSPLMAISILGWPVDKLPASVAKTVLNGARDACNRGQIPLAGGHSIDTVEPIFGLAVTGMVERKYLKTNNKARVNSQLYLTKPLGIGILTTAQKRGILKTEDFNIARELMLTLNNIGAELAKIEGVCALTDVTGFGLLGHLLEICQGSGLSAEIEFDKIPKIDSLQYYIEQKTFPGGTFRNFKSYSEKINKLTEQQKVILCDPQTSGGLLIAVQPEAENEVLALLQKFNLQMESFGRLIQKEKHYIYVD